MLRASSVLVSSYLNYYSLVAYLFFSCISDVYMAGLLLFFWQAALTFLPNYPLLSSSPLPLLNFDPISTHQMCCDRPKNVATVAIATQI
jgi:hypothetical protein